MNEREELLIKFNKAMPLVNELSEKEDKFVKYSKTKGTLKKVTVVVVGILVLGIIIYAAAGEMGSFWGSFPLWILLALLIFLSVNNKKKLIESATEMNKIINSAELSFIPASYLNSFDITGIYKVLSDMRADTLKEAINTWEQEKHNMRMEAKPTVIVK